jgi:hypothetical protein
MDDIDAGRIDPRTVDRHVCPDGCEIADRHECRMNGRSMRTKDLPEDACECDCHDRYDDA